MISFKVKITHLLLLGPDQLLFKQHCKIMNGSGINKADVIVLDNVVIGNKSSTVPTPTTVLSSEQL